MKFILEIEVGGITYLLKEKVYSDSLSEAEEIMKKLKKEYGNSHYTFTKINKDGNFALEEDKKLWIKNDKGEFIPPGKYSIIGFSKK